MQGAASGEDIACTAIGAAAAAWRATGGKRYKFLSALVRHLGDAPAGLRAPLAAAAIEPLTGRKNTHAGLFCLARAAIAHQAETSDDATAEGGEAAGTAAGAAELSAGDAGAAAAAVFARFPWPVRLEAVRKLLEWFVEPEEMARGGTRAVALAAAEVAALKAAAGQAEDEGVQEALKGVLNASLSVLTTASEVRIPCVRHG